MWLLIKIFTILSVCGCGAFLVIGFGGIAQSAYGNQLLPIYILITFIHVFFYAGVVVCVGSVFFVAGGGYHVSSG